MTRDPVRLLDGGEALTPDEERALGADLEAVSPVGAKRAIWAALSLKVALPAAAVMSSAATASAGAGAVTTLALVKSASIGLALGAAVGTGLYFGARAEPARPAAMAKGDLVATTVSAPFQTAAHPKSAPAAAASDSMPPSDSAPLPEEPAPPVERSLPRGDAPPLVSVRPAAPHVESESERVARARSSLRSGNAPGALSALESLARDEPNGLLVQEREALLVETLAALGRREAARERAAAFLERYPKSPHAVAVRRAGDLP